MSRPPEYFRAGAGAVIVNHDALVLALERADIPGAWQLPQGGLNALEEPLGAAVREVREETGIPDTALTLVDAFPEPLAYELPPAARSRKTGRGQVLYWFLFRFDGPEDLIDLADSREFRAWRWMPFDHVLEEAAEFRRPLYRQLARRFHAHLLRPGAQP